jgi:DNA-binding LacI/PurR family transcriptional regulator
MGATAAERLIAALEDRPEPASTLFEPELVSRRSCRAVEGRC